jgi:hypothetical protein
MRYGLSTTDGQRIRVCPGLGRFRKTGPDRNGGESAHANKIEAISNRLACFVSVVSNLPTKYGPVWKSHGGKNQRYH